jgi:hypothetical protein
LPNLSFDHHHICIQHFFFITSFYNCHGLWKLQAKRKNFHVSNNWKLVTLAKPSPVFWIFDNVLTNIHQSTQYYIFKVWCKQESVFEKHIRPRRHKHFNQRCSIEHKCQLLSAWQCSKTFNNVNWKSLGSSTSKC